LEDETVYGVRRHGPSPRQQLVADDSEMAKSPKAKAGEEKEGEAGQVEFVPHTCATW